MSTYPKFDYDGDDFYDEVASLALQGFNDSEIAFSLSNGGLDPDVFGSMKNGNYGAWSKEENERRSARLNRVLARSRSKTLSIVRGRYLKAALGGIKNKTKVLKYLQEPCGCGGGDSKCEDCGGTGFITSTTKAIVQESEIELPPNMQALATWLYHHDPEWRKIQRGKDEEADDIPQNVSRGVSISKWIEEEVRQDNVESTNSTGE